VNGYKIVLESSEIRPGVICGVIVISIDSKRGLSISGVDYEKGSIVEWAIPEWQQNKKIAITACEFDEGSHTFKETKIERCKLIEEYCQLKEFLQKEGII
jgi:hypothetical protein